MDPGLLTAFSEFIAKFGLGGGIASGVAFALHKGYFRLGRETTAEVTAATHRAEAIALREALAKSEKDLGEYKAIAMRTIQAAHTAVKSLPKGDPT